MRLSNVKLIILTATLSRLVSLLLLIILSHASSPFDTSHQLVSIISAPATLRWDAIHFTSIALHGYEHEQQLAFQPGWPGIMRLAAESVRWLMAGQVGSEDVVMGGIVIANLAFIGASAMLYK